MSSIKPVVKQNGNKAGMKNAKYRNKEIREDRK
jgi:hypothetical protein